MIEVDASERSITHHLANCVAGEFPEWDVDVEYNRDRYDIKRAGKGRVFPDIVVHRRGCRDNLLAIEVKKSRAPERDTESDRNKLREFTSPNGLAYRFGAHVVLNVRGKISTVTWFARGDRV